ncbi:MAG: type II secretion system protein [Candidatus Dechloromonas phosphoritropha]
MQTSKQQQRVRGFSLVELAIVLVIVALLTSGLLLGISAQRSATENTDAQRQLENIREALLGYAMANGRLPCPADPSTPLSNGGGGEAINCLTPGCPLPPGAPAGTPADNTCSLEFGVLPSRTLGVTEADPWGNRLTYFAGLEFSRPLSWDEIKSGRRSRFSLETDGRAKIEDGANHPVASNLPAVIVSHGSRAAGAWQPTGKQLPGATGDELENANATLLFISRTPSDTFDDLVMWISPSILKAKMVAAGRLP